MPCLILIGVPVQLQPVPGAIDMKSQSLFRFMSFVVIILLAVSNSYAEDLVVPDDDLTFCTVCHGVQLMGNSIVKAPRISGLDSWYVRNQLLAFKRGWRGADELDVFGMEMQPMAANLSEEQIDRAAKFVAATKSDLPSTTITGSVKRGNSLYSSCKTCHGEQGQGNQELGSPALAGQNDWYLRTQLYNFVNGSRGKHKDDIRGQQMRAAAVVLNSEQAINDVVAYIATFMNSNDPN